MGSEFSSPVQEEAGVRNSSREEGALSAVYMPCCLFPPLALVTVLPKHSDLATLRIPRKSAEYRQTYLFAIRRDFAKMEFNGYSDRSFEVHSAKNQLLIAWAG
jgi:hypothetical protein